MRRTSVLLACLLLAGASGCSDDGGDAAESKPSASPAPSRSVDPIVSFMKAVEDADFASYQEDGIPAYQDLEVFPPKWCSALDEGHSVEWMLDEGGLYPIGLDWGTAKTDAYQLVLLGVDAYCPKYAGRVKAELRESGAY